MIFGSKLLSSFLMSAVYRHIKTSSGNVDIVQLQFRLRFGYNVATVCIPIHRQFSARNSLQYVAVRTTRPVTTGRVGGAKPSLKFVSPPWKIVLDTFWNYWTYFKKIGPLSENSSSRLVTQAGYGPAYDQNLKSLSTSLTPLLHFYRWDADMSANIEPA